MWLEDRLALLVPLIWAPLFNKGSIQQFRMRSRQNAVRESSPRTSSSLLVMRPSEFAVLPPQGDTCLSIGSPAKSMACNASVQTPHAPWKWTAVQSADSELMHDLS